MKNYPKPKALRLTAIIGALLLPAVTGVATTPVYAQATVDAILQKIEKIEITGSNIKRIPSEGPVPVEIISRKEIERRGVTSTSELIRALTYMSPVNDELISNSPNASGAAAAGFRGLGGDQTVVLLNGRRLANYGFDGAFVNLNTIPLGALDRVEILKDGAAAIYGADAIGGVINFITRKDFSDGEVSGTLGQSGKKDGGETALIGTAGWGSLKHDKRNVMLNLNYFKRDPINNLDRERTKTADFSRFGGTNQLSTFAPSGNFVNPLTGLQAPFQTCPTGLTVSPSPLTPGSVGSASCLFDFAPFRTTLFGTERVGGLATARFALADHISAYAEVLLSRSDTFVSAAPSPGNFSLAVGNPANPFTSAISVRGRPLQAGARTTDNRADASRILLGLEGTFNAVGQVIEYNVALGEAKNKATNRDSGYFLLDRLNTAISNGTFNPFSTKNPATVVTALASSDTRVGETTNSFVDLKISTGLGKLPAGAVEIAAGAVVGQEHITDLPGVNQRAGNVFGSIQQSAVEAKRNLAAVFIELAVPVTRTLEAQLAVRHDRYAGSNGGADVSSTTPKIALRYQPTKTALFRASYSEGFKMPSLRDLFGGKNQSADSVQDFLGCAARGVPRETCPRLQYDRFAGGNAALQAEKAKISNIGMVFEPKEFVSIALDYFTIRKTDEIGLVLSQYVIDTVAYAPSSTTALGGNPAFSVTRNSGGTITSLNTALGNLGERRISGFDLSTNTSFKWRGFKFASNSNVTYYSRYDYADQPGTPLYGRLGLLNLPRWRRATSYTMNHGAWDMNMLYSVMASQVDKPQSTAAVPVTSSDRSIAKFSTVDVGFSYSGINNVRLSATIKNMLDTEPAFSSNDARTLGFSQVHDIRGRYLQVGGSIKF